MMFRKNSCCDKAHLLASRYSHSAIMYRPPHVVDLNLPPDSDLPPHSVQHDRAQLACLPHGVVQVAQGALVEVEGAPLQVQQERQGSAPR